MSKQAVESKLGHPKRMTSNEYGTKWYTYYNKYYDNFIMISYIKNHVNAMYSNQNIISSKSKIKYATPKHTVRERLGNPIEYISKGRYRFEVKIMNMMFSIKITFIQQFFTINMKKME